MDSPSGWVPWSEFPRSEGQRDRKNDQWTKKQKKHLRVKETEKTTEGQ